MRRKLIIAASAFVAGVTVYSVIAQPQAEAPKPKVSAADKKKAYAAKVAQLPGPSEQHKLLASLIGDFEVVTDLVVDGPDTVKFHGIEKGESYLGGLFVKIESHAAPEEEVKGERLVMYGYDPNINKYTMWQIESFNPNAITATGTYDAATKTFTFIGDVHQTATAKTPFHWILHILDNGAIEHQIQIPLDESGKFQKVVGMLHTPIKK